MSSKRKPPRKDIAPAGASLLMALPDAGFDRVAAFYDPLARLVFGRSLQRAQQLALAGLPPGAPHVLVIGGGTGWVLRELFRQRPAATVVYVEASAAMLRRARRTMQQHCPARLAQVEFRLGTEELLAPPEQFAAIGTFFFLDLFPPARLRRVLEQLAAVRQPGAPWLLADFAAPRTVWQRALLAIMYRFFRLTTGITGTTLPPIAEELGRLGLRPVATQYCFGGMVEAVVFRDGVSPAASPHPI